MLFIIYYLLLIIVIIIINRMILIDFSFHTFWFFWTLRWLRISLLQSFSIVYKVQNSRYCCYCCCNIIIYYHLLLSSQSRIISNFKWNILIPCQWLFSFVKTLFEMFADHSRPDRSSYDIGDHFCGMDTLCKLIFLDWSLVILHSGWMCCFGSICNYPCVEETSICW